MSIESKNISEHLARARGYIQRNDPSRALGSFMVGLKGSMENRLLGREKIDFEVAVREVAQLLMRNDTVQQFLPDGINYQPGQEKRLLLQIAEGLKRLHAHLRKGNIEENRSRKLRLDQAVIRGQKMLASGRPDEADASFQEALSLYVDEIALFPLLGSKYMDAGMPRQALPYLKQGLSLHPGDQPTLTHLVRAYEELKDFGQALQYQRELLDVYGETPDRLLKMADLLALSRDHAGALKTAQRILELNPNFVKAKRLINRVKKTMET